MIRRRATVWLSERLVGELQEDDSGYIELHLDRSYSDDADRPVLGQWFEDHPGKRQVGERPGDLPSFFANLIPEGDLGLLLRNRLGVALDDDFGLLLAVGTDLPGAVIVRADGYPVAPIGTSPNTADLDRATSSELRFSLAGVQLKFSMLRTGQRFVFPGVDGKGDWIVKIAHDEFAELCENEFVTMQWARLAGFDVPKCELRSLGELVDVPVDGDARTPVFVIQRYDRDGGRRIHQEDMQQVLGRRPSKKYDDATCEQLVLLLSQIIGIDGFEEALRRLVFVVASGNGDAHLKNWSLLYRDGITASLTPMYDQVFTAFWPRFAKELALNLGGTKQFAAINEGRFRVLAERAGQSPLRVLEIVGESITSIECAWRALCAEMSVPASYKTRIRAHWSRVPLLARHALS